MLTLHPLQDRFQIHSFAHLNFCRDIYHETVLNRRHTRPCLSHHYWIEDCRPQSSSTEGPGCPDCMMHKLRYLRGQDIVRQPHTLRMLLWSRMCRTLRQVHNLKFINLLDSLHILLYIHSLLALIFITELTGLPLCADQNTKTITLSLTESYGAK